MAALPYCCGIKKLNSTGLFTPSGWGMRTAVGVPPAACSSFRFSIAAHRACFCASSRSQASRGVSPPKARHTASRATTGPTPPTALPKAEATGRSFSQAAATMAAALVARKSGLLGLGGSVYGSPGSSWRISLSSKSPRLRASMILPLWISTRLE